MIYCGVDPGKSGGAAWLSESGILGFTDFAKLTPMEICNDFEKYVIDGNCKRRAVQCIIEAVGAFPGQGVHSMFVFGEQYGMVQGFLTALEIPFRKIAPVTWKTAMGIARKTGKTDRKERKRISRMLAQRIFPEWDVINDQNAEALLLADYCRRIYK
jgi:hypothetical protein